MTGSRSTAGSARRLVALAVMGVLALMLVASCSVTSGKAPAATGTTASASASASASPLEPGLVWDGSFEDGKVAEGANGPSCGTGENDGAEGGSDEPAGEEDLTRGYGSVEEMGNTDCTNVVAIVDEPTRTPDSERALEVRLGSGQQREQPQSTYTWTPDGEGTVEEWYGFSLRYAPDWNLGGGLAEEVSEAAWHNPIAFRMDGDNGSLNFSGDMELDNANGEPFETFSEPHMVLRRNTVMNEEGFYQDGLGLDKLDLGPIVVDRWMDFVCHIRWSTTETNALRECWRDGKYMGSRTSLNAVAAEEHRLRIGLYQATSIEHPRTAYYDNVRIGSSYRAVDPSRPR